MTWSSKERRRNGGKFERLSEDTGCQTDGKPDWGSTWWYMHTILDLWTKLEWDFMWLCERSTCPFSRLSLLGSLVGQQSLWWLMAASLIVCVCWLRTRKENVEGYETWEREQSEEEKWEALYQYRALDWGIINIWPPLTVYVSTTPHHLNHQKVCLPVSL